MNTEERRSSTRTRAIIAIAVLLIVIGVGFRVWGIFTEMTIDEIQSLGWGQRSVNVINLFTVYKFKHDNNHWLNSIYLHFVGVQPHHEVYRLFSLATGVLAIPVAWLLGRRTSPRAAWIAAALVGVCFQVAYFSAEARGYAPAAFFAVAAWLLLEGYIEGRKWYDAAGFWLACCLGVISHLTFVFAFAGFGLHALTKLRDRLTWKDLVALFAIPAGFMNVLYQVSVHRMRIGGGPSPGIEGSVLEYATQLAALPRAWWAVAILALVAAIMLYRQGWNAWLYLGVLLAPAVIIAVQQPTVVHGRYYYVCTPFLLILAARTHFSRRWAPVGVGLAAAWLVGQCYWYKVYAENGRGRYLEALQYIVAQSGGRPVTVGTGWGHREVRDMTLTTYFAKAENLPIRYVKGDAPTDWVIAVRSDVDTFLERAERSGVKYVPDRDFDYRGVSHISMGCRVFRPAKQLPEAAPPVASGGIDDDRLAE